MSQTFILRSGQAVPGTLKISEQEKREEVKIVKELNLTFKLEGQGWDNLLPSEINRIAGACIKQLVAANTAGGTVNIKFAALIGGKKLVVLLRVCSAWQGGDLMLFSRKKSRCVRNSAAT